MESILRWYIMGGFLYAFYYDVVKRPNLPPDEYTEVTNRVSARIIMSLLLILLWFPILVFNIFYTTYYEVKGRK